MCELYGLEPVELYSDRRIRARKEHSCTCCNRPILQGEKYIYCVYKFDGEMRFEKMCSHCEFDMDEFSAAHDYVRFAPSSLEELVGECLVNGHGISERLKWARMAKRIKTRRALTKDARKLEGGV